VGLITIKVGLFVRNVGLGMLKAMGKNTKEYVMNKKILNFFLTKSKKEKLLCANSKCGKEIKEGDRVVSVNVRRSGSCKTKIYHPKCYEELFV